MPLPRSSRRCGRLGLALIRDRPVLLGPQLFGVRTRWRRCQPVDYPQVPRCLIDVEFPAQALTSGERLDQGTDPFPACLPARRIIEMAGEVVDGDPHDI